MSFCILSAQDNLAPPVDAPLSRQVPTMVVNLSFYRRQAIESVNGITFTWISNVFPPSSIAQVELDTILQLIQSVKDCSRHCCRPRSRRLL
jgi:hypothetical protein